MECAQKEITDAFPYIIMHACNSYGFVIEGWGGGGREGGSES